MKYQLLSKILGNGNIENVLLGNITNGNLIFLRNNKIEIVSGKTNKFLGYGNIEQLRKYDDMIIYHVTNTFLYYLLNIETINKYNGTVEETV